MAGSDKIRTSQRIGFVSEMLSEYADSLDNAKQKMEQAVFNSDMQNLESADLKVFRSKHEQILTKISLLRAAVDDYGKIVAKIGSRYEEARKKAVARAKKIPH